jgi:hypothetical protein
MREETRARSSDSVLRIYIGTDYQYVQRLTLVFLFERLSAVWLTAS